jgi:hypothetical protein
VSDVTGTFGVWAFGVGFLFAAFSSIISTALGAVITIQSVLEPSARQPHTDDDDGRQQSALNKSPSPTRFSDTTEGLLARPFEDGVRPAAVAVAAAAAAVVLGEGGQEDPRALKKPPPEDVDDEQSVLKWHSRGWRYRGTTRFILFFTMLPTMADVSAETIIMTAQVVNGCILPFFATCLFLCVNDPYVMQAQPQTVWQNVRLFVALFFCWLLATNVILSTIFGSDAFSNAYYQLLSSFCVAGFLLSLLLWRTRINPFAPPSPLSLRDDRGGNAYEALSDRTAVR